MKKEMIEAVNGNLSLPEQCRLVALPRSRYYYVPHARHFEEELLAEIDLIYIARPYYGTRGIRAELNRKGEEVYIKSYENVNECRASLRSYFEFYNQQRVHQALGYATPAEVYYGRAALKVG